MDSNFAERIMITSTVSESSTGYERWGETMKYEEEQSLASWC